jgi:hypothetical protein
MTNMLRAYCQGFVDGEIKPWQFRLYLARLIEATEDDELKEIALAILAA